MIELPEAFNLADQVRGVLVGKRITSVTVGRTPHKMAWYYGDQNRFHELLIDRVMDDASYLGGLVELKAGGTNVLFGDGVNLRHHRKGQERPDKHQLLLEFDDGSALSAAVQMYGGMGAFTEGGLDNPYYKVARERPSPLSSDFDEGYFRSILSAPGAGKLSLKALLATEQRIPGLGNGVLQDILFNAKMRPRRKVADLSDDEMTTLFQAVKGTLAAMAENGGRDTEHDLFGRPGGYRTILSKNTSEKPCPVCGGTITKEAYMGGSVYYCAKCQRK